MGKVTPSGAAVRCSCVTGFKSVVLMMASPTAMRAGLQQCDQVSQALFRLAVHRLWGFFHFCNLDAPKNLFDALVYLPQRLTNGAALALAALAPHRDAGRNEQRTIDGANHFVSGNLVRAPRQGVTAIGAMQ